MNKKSGIFSVGLALGATMLAGHALADDPNHPMQNYTGFFGALTGAYIVDAGPNDWQLFGPNSGTLTPKTTAGDGGMVQGLLGYRFGIWDAAVGVQYMDLSKGKQAAAAGGANANRLSADMWAIDGMVGYNSMLGNAYIRTAFGLRYAEWDSRAQRASDTISHDWYGIGPRASVGGKLPLGNGLSVFGEGALAVLFGKTKTSATAGWDCTDCNTNNATSLNAEGKLGLGWALSPGVDLIAGYQLQYWNNVNVAITDDSSFGLNQGKSDYLTHGPYATVTFALGGN